MMAESRNPERTVWCYREFKRLNGAHVKHSHYFEPLVSQQLLKQNQLVRWIKIL